MFRWNRDFTLLAVASGCLTVAWAVYNTTFSNFFNSPDIGMQPGEFGILEFRREIPGLLTVVVAGLAMRIAAPRVAGITMLFMGVGIAGFAGVHSVQSAMLWSVVWSIGFHFWMPQRGMLALTLSDKEKGKQLGELGSAENLAALIAMALIFGFVKVIGFRWMFALAGGVGIVGGAICFLIKERSETTEQPRFVFKKQYGVYYLLTLLSGWRRQIVTTFIIFALVHTYSTDARIIIALGIVKTITAMVAAPVIGRCVDRFGERTTLSIAFIGTTLVFWGYATIQSPNILYVLLCVDNLFFLGSMAFNTYLEKIAARSDLRSTIAMGVSMDHISAVIMALICGWLWEKFNTPTPIYQIGAILTLISLAVSQMVRVPQQQE